MLKFITTLTILLFGILAKGQVTETRKIADFSKLTVKNATVIYTEGDKCSLKIESEYNDASETMLTELNNGTLQITGKGSKTNTIVYLSAKNVTGLTLRSNASFTVTNQINATNFDLTMNSGAQFTGNVNVPNEFRLSANKGTLFKGSVNAGIVTGEFHSNAKIIVNGTAKKAVINAKNETVCNARNFAADNLLVNAVGNANVAIYASNRISINVADAAKVSYNGIPTRVILNTEALAFQKCKSDLLVTYNY